MAENTSCPVTAGPASAVPAILEAQLHHVVMLANQAGKAGEPIGGQALLAMERLRALMAVELEKARQEERMLRPDLDVSVTQMRESNGRVTHSVYLHPKDVSPVASEEQAYSIYHSLSKGRADYEADCLRHVLDRRRPEPCVLDYDTDLAPTV